MASELIFLGTGYAKAIHCFNTCFLLNADGQPFLVDAGGGNGVLVQLDKLAQPVEQLHHMFLTHAHTDHMFGAVWIVRIVATAMNNGGYDGIFHIYCNDVSADILRSLCRMMLQPKMAKHVDERIVLHVLENGEGFKANGIRFTAFDINAKKVKQFGFRAELPSGKVLTCCGDEPYDPCERRYVEGCDWMLIEALCAHADRVRFQARELHHMTARDAGELAEELKVKNLVLYHTEDQTLRTRKAVYTADAKAVYRGGVYVPEDLDKILLD